MANHLGDNVFVAPSLCVHAQSLHLRHRSESAEYQRRSAAKRPVNPAMFEMKLKSIDLGAGQSSILAI